MTRKRRSFSPELKQEAASLVLDRGYTIAQASVSLGVGETAVWRWVNQLAEERDGVTPKAKPYPQSSAEFRNWKLAAIAWNGRRRSKKATALLMSDEKNRKTLTYELLSERMYKKMAAGVLDRILGHFAYNCNDNSLPQLTSVVVGKGRGAPGEGIPMELQELDARRENVYARDWYDVYPPSASELREAFERNAS